MYKAQGSNAFTRAYRKTMTRDDKLRANIERRDRLTERLKQLQRRIDMNTKYAQELPFQEFLKKLFIRPTKKENAQSISFLFPVSEKERDKIILQAKVLFSRFRCKMAFWDCSVHCLYKTLTEKGDSMKN